MEYKIIRYRLSAFKWNKSYLNIPYDISYLYFCGRMQWSNTEFYRPFILSEFTSETLNQYRTCHSAFWVWTITCGKLTCNHLFTVIQWCWQPTWHLVPATTLTNYSHMWLFCVPPGLVVFFNGSTFYIYAQCLLWTSFMESKTNKACPHYN